MRTCENQIGHQKSYGEIKAYVLAQTIKFLYDTEVYAYYFDLTFEETLKRHLTRSKCHEFGEEEMRRWWREKDFSDVLNETRITSEKNMESIVMDICSTIFNK